MLKFDESINAKDAWLKQVKHHRKRLKGLPRVGFNPNAGNVEYNISMMNKMLGSGEMISTNPVSGPFGGEASSGAGMGESLEEALKTNTAYMLRNDGVLFTLLDTHPYIYVDEGTEDLDIEVLVNFQPEWLIWFYKNTQYEDVKSQIQTLISFCDICKDYFNFNTSFSNNV